MKEENILIGLRPLIEALDSGQEIQKVLVQQGLHGELFQEAFARIKKEGIPYQTVPVQRIERVSKNNHQGVITYISPIEFHDLDEMLDRLKSEKKLTALMMLDGVTDVRNFGAIARSVECFGFDGIIISKQGASPVNADAIKSSAGALLRVPVCRVHHVADALALCQQYGLKVIAATEKGNTDLSTLDMSESVCIVLGNEEKGVSIGILRRADVLAKIDMTGTTKSLNVSVAGGILCYEVSKQHKK